MLSRLIKPLFILVCLLITTRVVPAASFSLYAGLVQDTAKKGGNNDVIKSKVKYKAADSIRFDVMTQKAFLFGKAEITYEAVKLNAAYIEFDLKNNVVFAKGQLDSSGKEIGQPVFDEGGKSFTARSMSYNFKTKKGRISEVITQEGEGYIHGETVKKDSTDVYYIKHGKYTTCNLKHPHFHIDASKLKVIPNDKIITGPANLVVADVPTPLALPFGFFPNKKGQASGILIPSYGESANWGFFLKDGGYYLGISDYFDLSLKGDIYTKGSWAARAQTNYRKRYKYNGGLNFSYSNIRTGEPELPTFNDQRDIWVRWSHVQDPKARPNSNFSADVNAGSSKFNKYNSTNPVNYLSAAFQSNINYTLNFPGTPFNLTTSATHSQNVISKIIDISLPHVTFSMNRVYPFKNSSRVESRWFDKIGVSYMFQGRNSISTLDSLLFREASLKLLKNGIRHSVPVSTSIPIFKYITLAPAVNLNSYWYLQTYEKRHLLDKTKKDSIVTDTIPGFRIANDYNFSSSLGTNLYGNYLLRYSRVKQIRHMMTPTLSYTYQPDFAAEKYGYYKQVPTDTLGGTELYPIFLNGVMGHPGRGEASIVSMALNNNLEMKVKRSAKDTVEGDKKITLLESLNISSSYNMAADSMNLSVVAINGRTKLFNSLDITMSGFFDPYVVDSNGVSRNAFEWDENKRLARLTSANLSLNTSLRSDKFKKKQYTSPKGTPEELEHINRYPEQYVDFNIPWSLNITYNLYYSRPKNLEIITQTVNFSGDLSVTKNWKVNFSSGYDLTNQALTYSSISILRDLHCWELSFNWIPFGLMRSYTLDIRVKAAVLQDLKLSRRRPWFDNL